MSRQTRYQSPYTPLVGETVEDAYMKLCDAGMPGSFEIVVDEHGTRRTLDEIAPWMIDAYADMDD